MIKTLFWNDTNERTVSLILISFCNFPSENNNTCICQAIGSNSTVLYVILNLWWEWNLLQLTCPIICKLCFLASRINLCLYVCTRYKERNVKNNLSVNMFEQFSGLLADLPGLVYSSNLINFGYICDNPSLFPMLYLGPLQSFLYCDMTSLL